MGIEQKVDNKMNAWASNARSWIIFSVTVFGIFGTLYGKIQSLSQQVALLNQKVELLVGDHEKRLTELEGISSTHTEQLNKLIVVHEPDYNKTK